MLILALGKHGGRDEECFTFWTELPPRTTQVICDATEGHGRIRGPDAVWVEVRSRKGDRGVNVCGLSLSCVIT